MHGSGSFASEDSGVMSEKKTISPPPDLPEEVTGNITTVLEAVLEALPGPSVPLKPPKPHFEFSAVSVPNSRTVWNPFASRFSPQYVRLNRILTMTVLFLLAVTLSGFTLIRQTQTVLTDNLLQIQAVLPNVLARQTQNTLAISVSDSRGLPKQVPVRVSLLSDLGEKIALYQEKTDSKGSLHLALESPANLPANVLFEISVGEENAARTVWQTVPVVEASPEEMGGGMILPSPDEQPQAVAIPQRQTQSRQNAAAGADADFDLAEAVPLAEPGRAVEHDVELILAKKEFDSAQPLQFQVRSSQPQQPLIASVSRRGIPLAQFPLKTSQSPGTLTTIDIPENDSLTGLLQIALFDPAVHPAREITNQTVVRRGNRSLKIEKIGESQTSPLVPAAIKITDERGLPVVAGVRFSWWKGGDPQTEVIPRPILVDNQKQIHRELEYGLSKRKPVFSEMLVFFTFLAIFGGTILAGVVLVLFFVRRLSGYTPLMFAVVTGTTCVLLGVSLLQDRPLPGPAPALNASNLPENDSENMLQSTRQSVTPEMYEQWAARSDAQGICPVNPQIEMEAPAILQIEVSAPDEREGVAFWEIGPE